ncbi:MAG: ABC transporter substrate-binding protein [Acetatifactor sp.]|nr:ABC transporter substrate-binding protein [Acetatifactor sp.]
MKKKVLSVLLATAMVASLAACGNSNQPANQPSNTPSDSNAPAPSSSEAPEVTYDLKQVKIMVDGTLNLTEETGLKEFEEAWEKEVGVDLVINKPDHSNYSEALALALAGSDKPDVVLMPAAMYSQYASFGTVLWDMTDAYENADFQSALNAKSVVNEGNYVNGRMYGMSPAAGNGCVTYVKKAWLDNLGMSVDDIKTYDDFYNMLVRFTTEDPDGNGVDGDTYGIIAPGLVSTEAPWTNYLPEFWQNAYPALLQDETGVWYDGFQTEETKEALERLRTAWAAGVIDPDTSAFVGETKSTREKWFGNDQKGTAGCFAYWAGTWRQTLTNNLSKNQVDTEVVQLPLIAEMDGFLDRKAPVWVIMNDTSLSEAENNARGQAIFDAFFETMLDGGNVQLMWTYGLEGMHWSMAAETVVVAPDNPDKRKETTYEEGQFHMLPGILDNTALYSKNHIDNILSIRDLPSQYNASAASDLATESSAAFYANAISAPALPSSTTYAVQSAVINDAVQVAVNAVVKGEKDYDAAMQEYLATAGAVVETVLAELNNPQ